MHFVPQNIMKSEKLIFRRVQRVLSVVAKCIERLLPRKSKSLKPRSVDYFGDSWKLAVATILDLMCTFWFCAVTSFRMTTASPPPYNGPWSLQVMPILLHSCFKLDTKNTPNVKKKRFLRTFITYFFSLTLDGVYFYDHSSATQ